MVSNTLAMENDDLVALLKRLGAEFSEDGEYQDLRGALPPDWPF